MTAIRWAACAIATSLLGLLFFAEGWRLGEWTLIGGGGVFWALAVLMVWIADRAPRLLFRLQGWMPDPLRHPTTVLFRCPGCGAVVRGRLISKAECYPGLGRYLESVIETWMVTSPFEIIWCEAEETLYHVRAAALSLAALTPNHLKED